MKKSFKRIITAMAAAMCAVPMTNILSASADDNTMTRTRSASVSGASVSAVSTTAKRTDSTLKEALTDRNSTAVIATEKIDDTVINGGKLVDREQLEEVIDIRDQLNGGIKGLGGRDLLGLDDFLSDLLSNGGILNHGGYGRDFLGLDGILGKGDRFTDLLSNLGHLTNKDFGNLGKVTGTTSFYVKGVACEEFSWYESNDGKTSVVHGNTAGDVVTMVSHNGYIVNIMNGKLYGVFGFSGKMTSSDDGKYDDNVSCTVSEDGESGSCSINGVTTTWNEETTTVSTDNGEVITFSTSGNENKDKKGDGQNGDNQNGDNQNDKKKDDSDEGTPIYDCDGCCTHNVSAAEAAAALAEWTDPLINTGENGRQRTPSDEELGAMLANRIDPLTNTGDSVQQRIPSDEELGAMLADRTDPCVDPVR